MIVSGTPSIGSGGVQPPALPTKGANHEYLAAHLRWIYEHIYSPGDGTIEVIQGVGGKTGLIFGKGGTGSNKSLQPLQIIDASDKDHAGRIRVVSGLLGGLLPAEMKIPDALLPGGTDNRCYLTTSPGDNYVYGKALIDGGTGLFTEAHVYTVTTMEEADGTFVYLLIGYVSNTAGVLAISQYALGNQSLLVFSSADGMLLQPFWQSA